MPQAGDVAPDFTLPASDGGEVTLSQLAADRAVVVYFYPKADTPGCTKQACGLRDTMTDLQNAGAAVVGISPDPVAEVTKFAKKFDLNFPLLADADHAVCEAYGVWAEKSMFGKKYHGANRTTFIVEQGGRVKTVFEKVKPEGHEQMVLEALRS
jgi:peroxiredoxin Q/BCP